MLLSILCSSCEAKVKTNSSSETLNQAKADTVNKKTMKKLEELINLEEPGWDLVKEWSVNAKNNYVFLPKDAKRADSELFNSQISTRSPMGAVIYETGGILIDYGWIRVLGSGNTNLDRGLMEWNKGKSFENYGDQSPFLLVADDVVGGYFAINAGGLGNDIGKIHYLSPDALEWENLECNYSEFLYWLFNGDIQQFYELFKWKTWKKDINGINGNQTFSFYPYLWTVEGKNIENVDKSIVPVEENYKFIIEMQTQIKGK